MHHPNDPVSYTESESMSPNCVVSEASIKRMVRVFVNGMLKFFFFFWWQQQPRHSYSADAVDYRAGGHLSGPVVIPLPNDSYVAHMLTTRSQHSCSYREIHFTSVHGASIDDFLWGYAPQKTLEKSSICMDGLVDTITLFRISAANAWLNQLLQLLQFCKYVALTTCPLLHKQEK